MKIAYVINSVEGGGAALPIPAIVALSRHGARVTVYALTRRDGRALCAIAAAGIETVVRDGGETDHRAAFSWLDAQVARTRADLIWTSLTRATLLGQWVGVRRRLPVVSWQHAAYLKPANRILLRATQHLSRLWIADSQSVAALTATRLGIAPERLATWPLFAADPAAPTATAWRPFDRIRLGTLGRLHPVKGHDVLIAAFARLRANGFAAPAPVSVTIAGEGIERGRLAAMTRDAGLDIELPGFRADPRAFLAGLHLYVQPSRSEGLCIAAHEAMQAGLPLIGSAVGEMPHSIADGITGLIVPPGDPDALASALARLLSAPDALARMGIAGRERLLERFGTEAFASAAADVVRRLPLSR